MRILRVIASMDPINGGPCQGIRNSIPAQKLLGVTNEVVCFDSSKAKFLQEDNFTIHALGPAVGPYAYCAALAKWLKSHLQSYNIVVIHGLWLYNSYGTFRIWKLLKEQNNIVPDLYVMPHGMLDPYFQKAKSRRLKAIRNWIFWKVIENKVINESNGLLFTCEQELLLARETFSPYNPVKEINIGYGVPLPPSFKLAHQNSFQERCGALNGKPYFLFLSRIHPKKGVDILIKAYLRLRKKYKDIPHLVIAGPGKETPYGKKLQTLGKGSSIHFPGMLRDSAKWGAFYGCEAFILTSHQENFGIALVEAMACEKPVLISDQVNIFREIKKGDAGIICTDTEEGVYEMLCRWISFSENEKAVMGTNSRTIYNKHYSIEEAASKMVKTFEKLENSFITNS